jgi:hypothetical protein
MPSTSRAARLPRTALALRLQPLFAPAKQRLDKRRNIGMDSAYFLTTLGLVPYFATRAFLPLFVSAMILRFGPQWGFVSEVVGITPALDVPPWATSNVSLFTLGAISFVEGLLQREPSLREKVSLTDSQLKAALALVFCLIVAPESRAATSAVLDSPNTSLAGLYAGAGTYAWGVVIAGLVWLLARQRTRLFTWYSEIDDDDDFGIQRLLTWLEEALALVGVWIVFLAPLLAGAAALGAIVTAWFVTRRLESRETSKRQACIQCQELIDPCAPHCPVCRAGQPHPRAVGLLGRTLSADAGADHAFLLKTHKRCSFCGSRIRGTGVSASCQRCSTPIFSSRAAVEGYLAALHRKTPLTLLILAALGSVPIFGLFAGILFYRLTLVGAVRHYAPTSARVFGRWILRAVNGALLLLQPVPALGIIVLPLMCLTNLAFYTRHVTRSAGQLQKPVGYSETLKS